MRYFPFRFGSFFLVFPDPLCMNSLYLTLPKPSQNPRALTVGTQTNVTEFRWLNEPPRIGCACVLCEHSDFLSLSKQLQQPQLETFPHPKLFALVLLLKAVLAEQIFLFFYRLNTYSLLI